MQPDQIFSITNILALICWLCLIFLPRWKLLLKTLKYVVISVFALLYSVIILLFFFKIEGGGFSSIIQVRAIFMTDMGLTAGWIHYLAFDLFVGLWIAKKSDDIKLHRALQAPILLMTFMFGPLGLLTFYCCKAFSNQEREIP